VTVIIFIVILAILVFVHEFGHFIVAKLSGIRVDEFCNWLSSSNSKVSNGETDYSLNLIPFGGYVKIFGEDPNEDSISGPTVHEVCKQAKIYSGASLAAGVSLT